jgi:moderate conductance mechanosensitive channel
MDQKLFGMLSNQFWSTILMTAGASVVLAIVRLIGIVIVYVLARFLLFRLIDGVSEQMITRGRGAESDAAARVARTKTLQGLLKSIVTYVLFFIAAVMTLSAFNINVAPVLTAAGVVGLAVGFGAQRLVRDVIAGFFILLENQFSVGEYVTMAGVSGSVEEIGMRITRLRDDSGKLNIIPNGDIASVCNHSRGSVAVVVEISVTPDTDPAKVADLLNRAGESLAKQQPSIITWLKYSGMSAMDGTKLTLKFAGTCQAPTQDSVQMAARELYRETLRQAGIALV